MLTEQERVAMMSDEERVAFAKAMNAEDYREIPAYWNEYLDVKIRQIHDKQMAGGVHAASFGVIADFHFTVNCLRSPALMEKILDECGIPYFFLAGDFVSGMGMITPDDLIREMVCVRRLFSRIEPKMLLVQGNHDPSYSTIPGHGYAESLTTEQIYEYMFRFQTQYPNRVFGEDGTYFYADDCARKMRYIVLNAHDTPNDDVKPDGFPVYPKMKCLGFGQTQLRWFAETALDVPAADSGTDVVWTVVLCTHESVCGDEEYYNRELVLGLIDAFRKHTVYEGTSDCAEPEYNASVRADFTGRGGDFAVWVGGHTHRDMVQNVNGILCLTTASDSFNDIGNTDEQCFDIFTVNKAEHTICATRIGRGGDREFSYETY